MGIINITRGLFAVKDPEPVQTAEVVEKKVVTINYQDYGFHQAFSLGGSEPGLRVCLQKLYFDFNDKVKGDNEKFEESIRPFKMKLEEHKGDIARWENKIKKIEGDEIPRLKERIETLKEEKSAIRKNPEEVVGDVAGKPSFYIGLFILFFLTVYLFVFYSSASYSTFFKEFNLSQIGIANSIFDAKALTNALRDGVMELVLIMTIPFVFLGLGYLIHKLQEEKGARKVVKIGTLVLVTFLFDAIMAYEITEKIYNIRKQNSFGDLPDFSISMAFSAINFWLIIFAGFIVYLIWGFVLDFVLEALGKLDKVKVALKEKDQQIADTFKEIGEQNIEIEKMTHKIDETKPHIKKLNYLIERGGPAPECEQYVFSFMAGWLSWMKGNGKSHHEQESATAIVQEFIKAAIHNYYPKVSNS